MPHHPFVVVHVPHSSRVIPSDVRQTLLLDDAELRAEIIRMTDWFTEDLFDVPSDVGEMVIFPVSRLVVDPERFEDDAIEEMAARGMGAVYTRTSHLERLRSIVSASEREALIDRFYRPHHLRFAEAVSASLHSNGRCLILDAHSFPSDPLPYETHQSESRPEICIGTDEFHTPRWLQDEAVQAFGAFAGDIRLNRPFSGAIVPFDFYQLDRRVWSLMLEIRRDAYMDEATAERGSNFETTRRAVQACLQRLIEAAAEHRI